MALRFSASIRMRVSRSGSLGPKGSEYGIKSTVKVVKNCLARPWLEAKVDVEWGKGFNREGDVLDVATKAHLVIYDWLRHENPRALLADAMIATGRTGATVICVVNAADKEFKADLAEWARERGYTISFDGSTTRVAPEKREGQ